MSIQDHSVVIYLYEQYDFTYIVCANQGTTSLDKYCHIRGNSQFSNLSVAQARLFLRSQVPYQWFVRVQQGCLILNLLSVLSHILPYLLVILLSIGIILHLSVN